MDPALLLNIFRAALSLNALRGSGVLPDLQADIDALSQALATKPDGSTWTEDEMREHLATARANFQEAELG